MTENNAKNYIKELSREEKLKLLEMLRCLERNRQRGSAPAQSKDKVGE